jgi:hypothetical protein
MSNLVQKKKDGAWKKVSPTSKDGKKKKKHIKKYTYNWCKHHIEWTIHIHTSANCHLSKQHKEDQKKTLYEANSATVAAATATAINLSYAALMATLTNLEDDE